MHISTQSSEATQDRQDMDPMAYDGSPRARDDSVLGEHLAGPDLDYDAIVVGAGLSGILSLHRLRQLGLSARVLEAGSAEGGTWFW